MIPVTKPFSPPIHEYLDLIKGVWERNWFTNNGPLVNQLEKELSNYLGVPNLLYLNNGTIALQIAIKALGLKGEIITTPFSYVATTSSIVWEGCYPVFVDIDPHSLNIDPNKIEEAITKDTCAILATHVYGNPCEIDKIQEIAEKHKIKVIYDAAHCFGTLYNGESIFNFGDISTTSFHATKLFHTIEGGAVFTKNAELFKKMSYLRNFGHDGPESFAEVGINGKNSEFHAAMGICNLKYIENILQKRKKLWGIYAEKFKNSSSFIKMIKLNEKCKYNFSYFPLILKSEKQVLKIMNDLNKLNIYPRRYFYPSLNTIDCLSDQLNSMPISEDISSKIICLPLYYTLSTETVDFISNEIIKITSEL